MLSRNTHFTIDSDSLSCLQSLQNMKIDHPYISSISYNYHQVVEKGKSCKFFIQYNLAEFKIPYTDNSGS